MTSTGTGLVRSARMKNRRAGAGRGALTARAGSLAVLANRPVEASPLVGELDVSLIAGPAVPGA